MFLYNSKCKLLPEWVENSPSSFSAYWGKLYGPGTSQSHYGFLSEPEEGSESQEQRRPRLDTGTDIFSQLTAVLEEVTPQGKARPEAPTESINSDGDTTIIHIPDSTEEVSCHFNTRQLFNMHYLILVYKIVMSNTS